ncbi:MAG: hypothetical protein HY600_00610 [Candidatus Omnitrophica bacterium]|nr:hypothetical protein [Candidatus Omnitrophota bacterium]
MARIVPMTAGADVRHVISDVTWAVWRALVARPPYTAAPPDAFLGLRQAVEGVMLQQWSRGGLSFVLSADRWIPELADRVAEAMEQPAGGGMARGPLGVLVADAARAALAPAVALVGRAPTWRVSAA